MKKLFQFGTAGIRCKMGPGEAELNTESIAKIAYSITNFLKPNSEVIIGYDGRLNSKDFAYLCAKILESGEHKVLLFDKIIPTPILAFSVPKLKADLGIMITASHNPKEDNGIKIYGPQGAQIISPETDKIEKLLEEAPSYSEISQSKDKLDTVPNKVLHNYFGLITRHTSQQKNSNAIRIAYTPMHGVGKDYILRALKESGFTDIHIPVSQAEPDGHFPTVSFPNPEEPGALDEVLKLAKNTNADLTLANDPDADRLAVCIDNKILTGNEIGALLAAYLLENLDSKKQKYLAITSHVSSRILSQIAIKNNVSYAETITGFANIAHLALKHEKLYGEQFIFGFEEALGYCIGNIVKDKDGISAAVCFANLFAELKSKNKTIFDELDRIYIQYGLFRNINWSLRVSEESAQQIMTNSKHLDFIEYLEKSKSPAEGLIKYVGEYDLRLIIRQSGTEPKIKFYAEATAQPKSRKEVEEMTLVLDNFLEKIKKNILSQLQNGF